MKRGGDGSLCSCSRTQCARREDAEVLVQYLKPALQKVSVQFTYMYFKSKISRNLSRNWGCHRQKLKIQTSGAWSRAILGGKPADVPSRTDKSWPLPSIPLLQTSNQTCLLSVALMPTFYFRLNHIFFLFDCCSPHIHRSYLQPLHNCLFARPSTSCFFSFGKGFSLHWEHTHSIWSFHAEWGLGPCVVFSRRLHWCSAQSQWYSLLCWKWISWCNAKLHYPSIFPFYRMSHKKQFISNSISH